MQVKDEILNQKAKESNIARFISFEPKMPLKLRYIWLEDNGSTKPKKSLSPKDSINELLSHAPDGVNIRSFKPDQPRGNPFIYGLKSLDDVLPQLESLAQKGLHTIVNETIPVDDGGVSGVVLGDLMEFAPDNTPKCVETPDGFCALPKVMGMDILKKNYGFTPDLQDYGPQVRVEFSIHPIRRGIRNSHTIIWETETFPKDALPEAPTIRWPNPFSRFLGDKVFGLLIADQLGFEVPHTTVVNDRIAPFCFGSPAGQAEIWMRACPADRLPGKYPTSLGWQNPFQMVSEWNARRDENDPPIVSVMSQASVDPIWSGSLASVKNNPPVIEGVQGRGDAFMVGDQAPESLPSEVKKAVMDVFHQAVQILGPVEMEWVFDGQKVWVVQLHVGRSIDDPTMIVPGSPAKWIPFPVKNGLEALRQLIKEIKAKDIGIELVGRVGVTSHFGHELLAAGVPSRLVMEN
jgi:hypothetical protein